MSRMLNPIALAAALSLAFAGCDVAEKPVQVTARPVVVGGTTVVSAPSQNPEAALEPAAGVVQPPPEAESRPTINVYLTNAQPDRPRCLMEVYDFVCDKTHTWNLCGGEDVVIAVCADEHGLGHTRVRIANATARDYEWVEFSDIAERDVLKR